jgi:hypothetical protein
MKISKYNSVCHFTLLLLALCFLASWEISCAQDNSIRKFVRGSEHCTWDRAGDYSYFYVPYAVTSESCEQWAERFDVHYIGEGNKEAEAREIPTDACGCGEARRIAYFDPQYLEGLSEPQACRGVAYLCSKPADDCGWIRDGSLTEDVDNTEECRLKARECGNPYFGFYSEQEASKLPEADCICGESTIRWYSDYVPSLSADLKCIGIKYRCLRKFVIKGPVLRFEKGKKFQEYP